jgi:6-phosphogluconate dehydrogenase
LQSALSQSVVISTINAAVEARVISSRKDDRVASSKILPQPKVPKFTGDRNQLITAVRDALYASKIVSYAQGMELLGAASAGSHWDLNFGDIATIWRGGCIIRAKFLNRITHGVAVPAFSASLGYFDSYRSARLPSNLLQAQRDFFGAHTYERVDRPGVFHTEWMESDKTPTEKTAAPKEPAKRHAGE